jgi:hypothetical protein
MRGFARSRGRVARQAAALGSMAVMLASCSHHRVVAVETPPPAPVAAPRPVLPAQLGAIVPPPRAADGGYQTINHGIDARRAEWHVRAALNVAAIGCRSEADAGLVPAYNAMLASQRAALAAADTAVKADFRARLGTSWQNAHDVYMTQLYNFFAQPAAKASFCAAADQVAPQAAAVPAGGFEAFAQTALPQLEAPFLANYRAVDEYRVALAAWTAGQNGAPQTELASAPAPALTPAGPQLGYAAMGTLIAWEPEQGATRLAAR